ncbi:MAG: 23S rRNA (guanosine(2251)-2'-O)-methyltransferase RlmB [Clostridiales bacterium]|nr:23S rRNA (guanosine(2251)-2'-O)-methyltransferase RlmB [Clostridiales bacterium]
MKEYSEYEERSCEPNENTVAGINAVTELLRSERSVDKLFIASKTKDTAYVSIIQLAKEKGIPFFRAEKGKLDALAPGVNHQGVVALAAGIQYVSIEDILAIAQAKKEAPFILIADKINDPHNLGAMIRCAEGAGVHGIIIPKRHGVGITPVVSKSSAGAVSHMAIAKVTNLSSAIDKLKDNGVWIYGAEADGTSLYQNDLAGPAAFVLGSEGAGISQKIKEKCDFLLSIPMYGRVNSFNVSTAAAVILCEAARQRNN